MGTKPEGITRRLLVLASAFATLNLRLNTSFVFDDLPGLIISRVTSRQRPGTPRAKAVRLEFAFGQRQQATIAKRRILLGASQIPEHLGSKAQENPPDFFRRMFHDRPEIITFGYLFPYFPK